MTEINPLDAAPDDGLERAFRLPQYIREDEELVALYEEIVARLRREAAGLPMSTLQQLLIERQASFYVQIKFKENTQTFSPNQQKEFNVYWLDLNKEFARQLAASDDKLREAMLGEIHQIVKDALELVTDPGQRRAVRLRLAEEFAAVQL